MTFIQDILDKPTLFTIDLEQKTVTFINQSNNDVTVTRNFRDIKTEDEVLVFLRELLKSIDWLTEAQLVKFYSVFTCKEYKKIIGIND